MDYRLYFMRGSRIRDVVDIHAANDCVAVGKAEKEAAGSAAELWCQDRRIATFTATAA